MILFRFSLLGLAGLVALIALGCAALVYSSTWLASTVWCATFLLLLFATLAALLRSAPARSWWIGFALFGWIVALTVEGPLSSLNKQLQTETLLQQAALLMPKATTTTTTIDHYGMDAGSGGISMSVGFMDGGPSGGMAEGMDMGMGGMPGGGFTGGIGDAVPVTLRTQDTEYISAFVRTSQALLTLLLACLGGFAGGWIQQRNRSDQPSSSAQVGTTS